MRLWDAFLIEIKNKKKKARRKVETFILITRMCLVVFFYSSHVNTSRLCRCLFNLGNFLGETLNTVKLNFSQFDEGILLFYAALQLNCSILSM